MMDETNSLSQLFKLAKKVFLTIFTSKLTILLLLNSSTLILSPVILAIAEVSNNDDFSISLSSTPLVFNKSKFTIPRALLYSSFINFSLVIGD